ncbi:MAG TPA: hypothetical protein ENK91_05325 [Bacteroidetes bacterium]|nr:hypothetical protein [Bacteroidota bacterium]
MNREKDDIVHIPFKDLIPIFVLVIGFAVFLFIGFYRGTKNSAIREKESKEARKRWINEFKVRGIKTISFVLDDIYVCEVFDHGDRWRRVDKVYVNDSLINPDSLYNKQEFIIKNCDYYYYFITGGNIDSVIYQFSPKMMYLEHRISDNLYSVNSNLIINGSRNKKYKLYLPKCWD